MSGFVVERIPKKAKTAGDFKPSELVGFGPSEEGLPTAPQAPLPSVGRIVHFRGLGIDRKNGEEWHAAIVTGGSGLRVNLRVFFDNGPIEYRDSVEHESTAKTQRCWRWPPRS
jgi:hypothetical protein